MLIFHLYNGHLWISRRYAVRLHRRDYGIYVPFMRLNVGIDTRVL